MGGIPNCLPQPHVQKGHVVSSRVLPFSSSFESGAEDGMSQQSAPTIVLWKGEWSRAMILIV